MTTLSIHHKTTYHYAQKLHFGPHRLMLRPRESRNLRLMSHDVTVTPSASVTWAHDVSGNSVATAQFQEASTALTIDSLATLHLDVEQWPVFDISAGAAYYPFTLSEDDMTDLGALRLQSYLDSSANLRSWANGFVAGHKTGTLALLKDLCEGVASHLIYEVREEDAAQTPQETLARRRGSCRDFAVLFVDAVRSLGFGARIVSGYLYDPTSELQGNTGAGTTHAWAEVFVPGAGWITFDPTNRSVGGHNLIPVAVGRHISQVMPVSGSFIGDAHAFQGMDVSVTITPVL